MLSDGAKTVVAGIAAARLHPHFAGDQIELVVKDQHIGVRELEEALRILHRAAAIVHVGVRFQKQDAVSGDAALAGKAMEALSPAPQIVACGDAINGHEAHVVAMARVGRARIAEADKELHVTVARLRGAPHARHGTIFCRAQAWRLPVWRPPCPRAPWPHPPWREPWPRRAPPRLRARRLRPRPRLRRPPRHPASWWFPLRSCGRRWWPP